MEGQVENNRKYNGEEFETDELLQDQMFYLDIISPEKDFYHGQVFFVEMTTTEGDIGVYRMHIPVTCMLEPGIVRIYETKDTTEPKKAVIHGGFTEILRKRVRIMAEIAEWPEEIDLNRAEEARIRAERMLAEGGDELDYDKVELALKRSLARINALK